MPLFQLPSPHNNGWKESMISALDELTDILSDESNVSAFELHSSGLVQAWLPDGYSQMFKIVCVWPFGHLDYGSATLCCKI